MRTRAPLAAWPSVAAAVVLAACGADIDLGGSADAAGSAEAAPLTDATGDACADLVPPTVTGPCLACNKSSSDCQPNGCYGGYWCDAPARDCQQAPKACP